MHQKSAKVGSKNSQKKSVHCPWIRSAHWRESKWPHFDADPACPNVHY